MSKSKLSIEDFYHQFHGIEHHNDPGDHVKTMKHTLNPNLPKKHKGLDLKALRNRKQKRFVVVHKDMNLIKHELSQRNSRK